MDIEIRPKKSRRLAAQAQMMEYSMMAFVFIVIILLLLLFLAGWWGMQAGIESRKDTSDRALFMAKIMMHSTYLTASSSMRQDPVLDYSKLDSMQGIGCAELQRVFGTDWFMEVELRSGGSRRWSFCVDPDPKKIFTAFELPVNVLKKDSRGTGEVLMAVLKAGVYHESGS